MKSIIIYILINLFWMCLSKRFHIHINNTIRRPESNFSKYLYHTGDDDVTDTPDIQNICNVSSIENSTTLRFRKRSIDFHDETTEEDGAEVSTLSQHFRDCVHTTVEPECYERLQNGSVYVPLYKRLFDRRNYVIKEDVLFVCPDFFDILEEKFSTTIEIISVVGMSISTVCIILHIIMFFSVEKLRNLPGYCLFSLCMALLMSYTCAFIQSALHEQANCKVIGMFLLYSLLSSFFWMNVISYDVWRAVRLSVAKFRRSSDTHTAIRFGLYSAYAWGTPLLIIIIAVAIDRSTTEDEYKLIFRVTTCWFQYKQALLVYFVLPLLILLIINIFFFISSFYMIATTRIKRSDCGSQARSELWSRLLMSLRLGTVMGLMWIFGVIATLAQLQWMYYLYVVCNTLQGVFIFFSFTLNDRTKLACKKAIHQKKISILPTALQESTAI